MWVLILFYLSSANASVAMHDFASQAACEHAREVAQGIQSGGWRHTGSMRTKPIVSGWAKSSGFLRFTAGSAGDQGPLLTIFCPIDLASRVTRVKNV